MNGLRGDFLKLGALIVVLMLPVTAWLLAVDHPDTNARMVGIIAVIWGFGTCALLADWMTHR